MGYLKTFHPCFVIIFLFFHLLHFSAIEANNGGFSVKLIRKNSLHDPSRRLMGSSNPNAAQSTTTAYLGHYLMELSIGTPPVTIYGITDTGSNLIWTQCVPCDNCYKQSNPMFDPQKSSTYSNISCESQQCHKIIDTGVCSPENRCNYTYGYAGGEVTQGVLAHETITLTSTTGQPVSLEGIIFGCGHNNTGTFNDHEMGIIGLAGGPASLISQIGSSFGSKRFSQCLVPFHTDISISSRMSFGDGSEVLGDDVVSTPLVVKQDPTPYFVTLQGISVGDTYLPFNDSSENVEKGNMFIDSGTPPTILPQQLYDRVVAQVMKQVPMNPIEGDPDLGSQLCYRTSTIPEGPILTVHFEGADVPLTPIQTFIPPKDGVFCLGLTNSSDVVIYGNFAQSNYLIGFDLERHVVSFKPMDCTKH
ncbi:aspartic proteinase CDR1-like [Gastrolobium bilobum]|uniref:aspartic proteinase CDR1-like n=1 Tax=Gastrolobium bilobum TaxID=150636 RepID=UPI002AB309F3|nr:aspartic proteinase CDR1-like [Gastrolobium bilobum]